MDILLNGGGEMGPEGHYAAIFPETQFTCNGRLLSWVFGAEWEGNSSFTEFQIWRPVGGNRVYNKVASTTIRTSENLTQLYHYPLSSPLAFQAGDVLGFYQPSASDSQLRILYEKGDPGEPGYYYDEVHSPPSELNIRQGGYYDDYNLFINVTTGEEQIVFTS